MSAVSTLFEWPEVNCANTMQDAVAVINPAGDEGVHHVLAAASDIWRTCTVKHHSLRDPMFSPFGTIPACDGRKDGQTDRHTTTTCTALA